MRDEAMRLRLNLRHTIQGVGLQEAERCLALRHYDSQLSKRKPGMRPK